MKNISRRLFVNKVSMGIGGVALLASLPSFMSFPNEKKTMYNGKKLNIALCGLGNYATMLAEGLQSSQYCKLAGIITGTPEKAANWKSKYNIPDANIYSYENFDSIVNNKEIDLVYVVTPNALHKEFVIRAAKAGKHVITEKPMAVSVQDCKDMIKACKEAGVQLAMGYRLHFEPTHKEIKRLGQDKVFGKVRYIEAGLGYKTYDTIHLEEKIDFNDRTE